MKSWLPGATTGRLTFLSAVRCGEDRPGQEPPPKDVSLSSVSTFSGSPEKSPKKSGYLGPLIPATCVPVFECNFCGEVRDVYKGTYKRPGEEGLPTVNLLLFNINIYTCRKHITYKHITYTYRILTYRNGRRRSCVGGETESLFYFGTISLLVDKVS